MKIALMLQQSGDGYVLQQNRTVGIGGNNRIAMTIVRRMGHGAGNIRENCMVELNDILAWVEVRYRVVSEAWLEDERIRAEAPVSVSTPEPAVMTLLPSLPTMTLLRVLPVPLMLPAPEASVRFSTPVGSV